jgi:acetone carboxylase gamma subunit
MTKQQKEILRDLFEGCFDFNTAVQMIGCNTRDEAKAAYRVWHHWSRQMDEQGYYTF